MLELLQPSETEWFEFLEPSNFRILGASGSENMERTKEKAIVWDGRGRHWRPHPEFLLKTSVHQCSAVEISQDCNST